MDAFFSFLKVIAIGGFALIALVLVLLAIPQTRFKSTLTEFLAWLGFVGGRHTVRAIAPETGGGSIDSVSGAGCREASRGSITEATRRLRRGRTGCC